MMAVICRPGKLAGVLGNGNAGKVLVALLVWMVVPVAARPLPQDNDMGKDACAIASDISMGWNLGNTLEAGEGGALNDEMAWGNPRTTQSMIDSVAAAGFGAVRIPVRWYPHFVQDSPVRIDSAWIGRVKEVVDYCLKNDLYVILNTHHELWLENHPLYQDSAEVLRKERELWTQIALAFGGYDGRLLFSGTNEVHVEGYWGIPTPENVEVQNRFNQVFVDAVRATGGRNRLRTLVVQTYVTNPEYGPGLFRMPTDPTPGRLMVEVHYYEPQDYCFTGRVKLWGKEFEDERTAPRVREEFMDSVFSHLKSRFADAGYPVVLGEFGAARWQADSREEEEAMARSRCRYYGEVVRVARRNGMVPFVWDNGCVSYGKDQYGLFDRRDNMRQVEPLLIRAMREGTGVAYPF